MFRLIAGALLFTSSAIFGISVKKLYRERNGIYRDLVDFTEYLNREIRCLKTPLAEVIAAFTDKKSPFGNILKKYSEGLIFGYADLNDVREKINNVYLRQEDNLLIASFLYGLGKSDYQTEITNLERYKGIFNKKLNDSEVDLKKNGDLYYKLSVLLGITAMLLVV